MNINSIGLETLCTVQAAVRDAGGNASVVIDSDDLVTRPEATMAAYCAAVGLPFIPRVENSPDLARVAARHQPFYDRLYAQRLNVTP